MKNAVTLLSIGVVLLLGLLFLTHKQADKRLAQARDQSQSLSNEIQQLKAKLTQHTKAQLELMDACSNQVTAWTALSNQWQRAAAQAKQAEAQTAAALAQLQALQQKLQALEQERSELVQSNAGLVANLQALRAERDAAGTEAGQLRRQRDQLQDELNRTQAQLAEARRHWDDLAAVQARLKQLKDILAARKSSRPADQTATEAAEAQAGSRPPPTASLKSKQTKLVLQPDGTVRVVPISPEPAPPQ